MDYSDQKNSDSVLKHILNFSPGDDRCIAHTQIILKHFQISLGNSLQHSMLLLHGLQATKHALGLYLRKLQPAKK